MRLIYTLLFISLSFSAMAAAPTVASSNLSFNAIDGGYFNLGWTSGNGARRIIVCKAGTAPGFIPQNGIDYTSSDVFGQGQEVAPGEFILFDHFSSSFFVTGLTPATQYFFRIFEYNGTGSATEYLTASFLSGSGWTSASPTVQTSNASFPTITTNSVTVNWTNGNGARRLIVVREGAAVNADPVNSQPYSVNAAFGSGATTGAGNYTVYGGSSTATTITNLKQGTTYFLAFYEYNGSQQPQYKLPAYTASVTTRSAPTTASSGLAISKTDGKELSLNWTNGNGQRRIIIAKQGSDVLSTPANGTDYTANSVFGSGQQLGAGEYVVYDDNFNAATISGLNPATTYYFKIFEYDGTGSNTIYLTSSFASVNGPTADKPTVQTVISPTTNITSSSLRLNMTPGNGRARLIIGHKDAAVNVTPADLTAYTANSDFGSGQDLGNGNYVLAITTESWINVQNLSANASYHFAIYELNGFNQPLYLTPAATTSAVTSGALPVTLLSWEAKAVNAAVQLHWKTSEEINTRHFIIERSTDGITFLPLFTVNAAGNSQTTKEYSKEDPHPVEGRSYYRLKMVDLDESWSYSAVRSVWISSSTEVGIRTNLVQQVLQVQVPGTNENKTWKIINPAGQVIKAGVLSGSNTDIMVWSFPSGRYWLQVEGKNKMETISFLKQ